MKTYHIHREPSSVSISYEADLNEEQLAAVMHPGGPALVLAGAGTGKTRVVTYRVARLIETGVSPENILMLTFTNKAAREMMRRVEQLAGRNIRGIRGGTFHHIGNMLLRKHSHLAGYSEGFSIMDREDSKELFDSCIAELHPKNKAIPKGSVISEIFSLSRNTDMDVEQTVQTRFSYFMGSVEEIAAITRLYEKKKSSLNLADFDDLLLSWKTIFSEHPNIREYYGLRFRHILVDEYQDTNRLQAEIVRLSTGEERNLMVVGDDAQSIYSFRGAEFENILKFPDTYAGTKIFKLTTNYRSTPEILHLANRVIAGNQRQFRKELHAVSGPGALPNIAALRDMMQQAEFVSSVILDLNVDGTGFDDIAVLYRSHYQSMELQMEFQRRAIPFEVRSGLKFFEQAHIKDMISFLKITLNPHDEIGWKRVLKLIPGIGNITAGKIWGHIHSSGTPFESLPGSLSLVPKKAREKFGSFLDTLSALRNEPSLSSPSRAIRHVLGSGYEDHLYAVYPNAEMRIEDIEQMSRFAAKYETLEAFLSDLALQGIADPEEGEEENPQGKVILSTVHQAKGLEWKTVFLIGLNDGRFPSAKALKSGEEEEERRLFYVGVTRAKDSLYLCYPVAAEDWQGVGFLRPSRFLRELPADSFEEISVEDV